MVSLLSLSKYIVKGSKANEVNALLKQQLIRRDGNFSVRNGIGILKENGTRNFGTTNVTKFFGLDETGNLVLLKEKAVYHCKPCGDDMRNLNAKWDAYNTLGVTTSRSTTSVDGKITEFKKWSANDGGHYADLFYRLGFGQTGVMRNRGTNLRYIEDVVVKRGSAFEGNIYSGLPKIKGFYNPNLGAGYILGIPGETKAKIVSKEQYDAILSRAIDLVR